MPVVVIEWFHFSLHVSQGHVQIIGLLPLLVPKNSSNIFNFVHFQGLALLPETPLALLQFLLLMANSFADLVGTI